MPQLNYEIKVSVITKLARLGIPQSVADEAISTHLTDIPPNQYWLFQDDGDGQISFAGAMSGPDDETARILTEVPEDGWVGEPASSTRQRRHLAVPMGEFVQTLRAAGDRRALVSECKVVPASKPG